MLTTTKNDIRYSEPPVILTERAKHQLRDLGLTDSFVYDAFTRWRKNPTGATVMVRRVFKRSPRIGKSFVRDVVIQTGGIAIRLQSRKRFGRGPSGRIGNVRFWGYARIRVESRAWMVVSIERDERASDTSGVDGGSKYVTDREPSPKLGTHQTLTGSLYLAGSSEEEFARAQAAVAQIFEEVGFEAPEWSHD